MDQQTIEAKMATQLQEAQRSAMTKVFAWEYEVSGLVTYIRMRPRKHLDRSYLLRVSFDDYPQRAPSYVFVDATSRQLSDGAWPPGVKHSDPLPGICTPGTREFHEKYHAGDAQYPWSEQRYSFLDTLQRIHALIEHGLQ